MPNEKHIIRKAVVEVYLPHREDALLAQQKALAFFKDKLMPMIEKIVERLALQHKVIRIDKLDLDFHRFNPEQTSESALRNFEVQVEEKLLKLISEEGKNNFAGDIITDVKKIPKERADLELLLHLLKTGTLPWWAKTDEPVVLKHLVQQLIGRSPELLKEGLFTALSVPEVRKRIAFNLLPAQVEQLIRLLASPSDQLLKHIAASMAFMQSADSRTLQAFRDALYEYALLLIRKDEAPQSLSLFSFLTRFISESNDLSMAEKLYAQSNTGSFPEKLYANEELQLLIKKLDAQSDALTAAEKINVQHELQSLLEKIYVKSNAGAPAEVAVVVKIALAKARGAYAGKMKKLFSVSDRKLFFAGEKDASAVKPSAKAANKEETPSQKKRINPVDPGILFPETESGDYFIGNAGIVIIAPYLPPIFKELGLYDGKEFISEEARARAVCLLQFLATGAEELPEEHELVLNKILCGYDLYKPLTTPFVISEKEKEECLNLLQAVADNWPALRGTSGTGMRDAFFRRDGILEQQSNGWNLNIERTTIDILLNKLPWGISVIGMPWSRKLVFVSW